MKKFVAAFSKSIRWVTVLAFVLPFASAMPSFAQTSLGTSTVTGTVHDETGAVVQNAAATLVDTERGTSKKTVTNKTGDYLFQGVLPGVYSLQVAAAGFQMATTNNVRVVIDQSATINVALMPGDVTQTVEVNDQDATPLLEQSSNALGTVIDNKQVEELPLNGRNFLDLAELAGGTEPPTSSNQTGHPSNSNTVAITGSNVWLTGYNINGIATRSPRIGDSSLNLSLAAIDQFKIEYGFFLPDKGPQLGIVDIVTKAGTNRFHGEAFEYIRNPSMGNAQNYFSTNGQPDNIKRNQFGGALGGPVWIPKLFNGRDRMWFFANYEGVRQVTKTVSTAVVPTAAMFDGDFSQTGVNIYNPFLYDPVTHTRPQFPGNKIGSYINPISKALLAYYVPAPNVTTGSSGPLVSYPRDTLNDDQFTIRLDGQISERQSAFVSWSYENSPRVVRSVFPLKGTTYPLQAYLASAQDTLSIGSRITNIVRIGYNHALTFQESEGQDGPDLLTAIGITGTLEKHGIPNVGLSGGYTAFGNAFSRVGEISNAYQLNEAFNYLRGKHSIAAGIGIVQHRVLEQNSNAGATGSVSFQPVYSAALTFNGTTTAPKSGTGNSFADFLLGLPLSGSVTGFQPLHYYFMDWYPYFQDSWRVSPNFTVNYGVAWYVSTIPNPRGPDANLSHDFNFSTGLVEYSALGQVSPQVVRNDYNNVTPRLGFVYAPTKNTTVRAGVGVYYGQLGLNDLQYASVAPPFTTPVKFTNSQNTNLPVDSFGNGVFPVVPLDPLSLSFAANLPAGVFSILAIDPGARTPYVTQWNLSVQHTLTSRDLLEADYVGSSGHDGTNRFSVNQCAYRADLFCDTTTIPYPRYTGISLVAYNTNTAYSGLILKYQHQLSHGLAATLTYTYQRAMLDGFEPNGPAASTQNSGCHYCDWGPPTYNIPQILVTSVLYDLPLGRGRTFGRNMPKILDEVIGGWRVTTIGHMRHGANDDVTSANETNSSGNINRAQQLCNGNDSHFSGNVRTNGYYYFNTACYAQPALHYFGNSRRGAVYDPGVDSWDASLVKSFAIVKGTRLEVRGDFFNVFNHANFGAPDVNASDKSTAKFGKITSAKDPRILQVSGRLVF